MSSFYTPPATDRDNGLPAYAAFSKYVDSDKLPSSFKLWDISVPEGLEIIGELKPRFRHTCEWTLGLSDVQMRDTEEAILVFDDHIVWYGVRRTSNDATMCAVILYTPAAEEVCRALKNKLSLVLKKPVREAHIYMVGMSLGGALEMNRYSIRHIPVDLELLYGKAYATIHATMVSRFSTQNDKGIAILYGPPGTGKTSAIRDLIAKVCDQKNLIYIPPSLTDSLTTPAFTSFIGGQRNAVLIIEDAENILKKRQGGSNQAVSNLLNLSDGLLSDALSIQIVCTVNSDISELDPALLRKGRMIAKHYFGPLDTPQVERVVDVYGLGFKPDKPMTLAEIFNHNDADYADARPQIGFGSEK